MNAPTEFYTYQTAPYSPILSGTGITERQLRRAVDRGNISYCKPGLRILFSESDLREFMERSRVEAVR